MCVSVSESVTQNELNATTIFTKIAIVVVSREM